MTVESNRTEGRQVLTMVNTTVKDRARANRHVFVEQPQGSQWLEEPEMKDVREMIDEGTLLKIDVHGCRRGYHDKESGLPHYKPTTFVTSMLAAEAAFNDTRYNHNHTNLLKEPTGSQDGVGPDPAAGDHRDNDRR